MSLIRKITLFLLLVIALLPTLIPHPLPLRNKNFSSETISTQIPFNPEWEGRKLSEVEEHEVSTALSQPYRYLGGGGQCFSFVSSDNRYVIKFFKQSVFEIPICINHFTIP